MDKPKIKPGIDNLLEDTSWLNGKRIALLTNSSGVNEELRSDLDLLMEKGIRVIKLFGPEHGFWGAEADTVSVSNEIEPGYRIPIFSLFGTTTKPVPEMLNGIDIVIYDIQDVGLRFYTYIYSLAYTMEECGKREIKVIVLDRPNPLSGKVEGPVIEKKFESFVGGYGLALRYGLTAGELALYYNKRFKMNVDLEVVKMKGWKRWMYYDDTNLLWNNPSPNIPSFEHLLLYPGFCLIEGTNVSEGRGTVHPFKYIGAPWIDSHSLFNEMQRVPHPGISFRERSFIPLTSKHANKLCRGLEFFVENRETMRPIELALDLISTIKRLYPEEFEWDTSSHRASGRYHFDLLMGNDKYRLAIDEGKGGEELSKIWTEEMKEFEERVREFWLY